MLLRAVWFVLATSAAAQPQSQDSRDIFDQNILWSVNAGGGIGYVADKEHHVIRRVSPEGVKVIAGTGQPGFRDGAGDSAQFDGPSSVAFDLNRKILYVADPGNNRIRQVTRDGAVSTFAGSGDQGGSDGSAGSASFDHPYGVILDSSGNVHIKEAGGRLRVASPDGVVKTDAQKAFLGYLRVSQRMSASALRDAGARGLPSPAAAAAASITVNPRYGYTSYGADTNRTYDPAGNLTHDSKGSYLYDAKHRLVEADLTDGTKIEYGYDALDRRVEKRVTIGKSSTTTTYVFDGWNVVQEYTNGALARENVLAEGLDQPLEYRIYGSPTRDYTIFRDLRGSAAAVVADDGSIELFKYLPFGKASRLDGSGDYDFDLSSSTATSLWQGLEFDKDLGWYYARHRWYDPVTGSFTSTDPLGYPDSPNPYVWGVGSSWSTDPLGTAMPQRAAQWYDAPVQGKLARENWRYLKWLAGEPRLLFSNNAYRREFLTTTGGLFQHGLGWIFNRPEFDVIGMVGAVRIPAAATRLPKAVRAGEGLARAIEESGRLAKSGETAATQTGRAIHEALAEERRAGEVWDLVNQTVVEHQGDPIRVPRRVDLETGAPIAEKGTQVTRPDAVSFNLEIVLDDKPLTRSVVKDRQEIIRYIRAYEKREGRLPKTIAIQRYDPATGRPIRTDLYRPEDFLPKSGASE